MAGMFYSLKEAAAKLNITEQEVKDLAKQGKLREFRDGSNLLFKIDEVEAMMADMGAAEPQEEPLPMEETEEFTEAAEPEMTYEPEEIEEPQFEEAETPSFEEAEAPQFEEQELQEQATEPEEEITAAGVEGIEEEEEKEEDILLAPESGAPAAEGDLSGGDTALTGEGINVLGETDHDYQLTDDTMAETTIAPGTGGTAGISSSTGEAMLEEIEDDVTLDSFGSGSGLLDLSLQADDTSLGGILDEIYTSEGGEEGQEPVEPSTVEMVAEAESAAGGIPEEEIAIPSVSITAEAPIMAQSYAEVPPDSVSTSLGIMLFLPLLALIYAGIVAIAGLRNIMPSILGKIQIKK
jgi:excisionase family DNA binding protein